MQPLQNCISPTILIGQESWCLPYAGFFYFCLVKNWLCCVSSSVLLLSTYSFHICLPVVIQMNN